MRPKRRSSPQPDLHESCSLVPAHPAAIVALDIDSIKLKGLLRDPQVESPDLADGDSGDGEAHWSVPYPRSQQLVIPGARKPDRVPPVLASYGAPDD
jgi:hypothetical protein